MGPSQTKTAQQHAGTKFRVIKLSEKCSISAEPEPQRVLVSLARAASQVGFNHGTAAPSSGKHTQERGTPRTRLHPIQSSQPYCCPPRRTKQLEEFSRPTS